MSLTPWSYDRHISRLIVDEQPAGEVLSTPISIKQNKYMQLHVTLICRSQRALNNIRRRTNAEF